MGKARLMEMLSNCGVYRKVSDLILYQSAKVADNIKNGDNNNNNNNNPYIIPQIRLEGLEECFQAIESHAPSL